MWPAIVGALIGSVAVVVGVYLSQSLVIRNREVTSRLTLSQNLMATMQEMLKKMTPKSTPSDWEPERFQINQMLIELEAACSHVGRARRRGIEALTDECQLVLVNAPGRATAAGGVLPEVESKTLMRRIVVVALTVRDIRGRVSDPIAYGESLDFYALNGLDASRPGNPGYRVPARNWVQRLRWWWHNRRHPPAGETKLASGGRVKPFS
jgi:hypothetical protein